MKKFSFERKEKTLKGQETPVKIEYHCKLQKLCELDT